MLNGLISPISNNYRLNQIKWIVIYVIAAYKNIKDLNIF